MQNTIKRMFLNKLKDPNIKSLHCSYLVVSVVGEETLELLCVWVETFARGLI